MALMFSGVVLSWLNGIAREISEPARTGVQVATGLEVGGTVAVCTPVPTEMNAVFGPSFTTRSVLPVDGSAVELDADVVTAIFSVLHCAENKLGVIYILSRRLPASAHISSNVTEGTPTVIPRMGSCFFTSMIRSLKT